MRAAFLVDPVDNTRYSPESPENPSGRRAGGRVGAVGSWKLWRSWGLWLEQWAAGGQVSVAVLWYKVTETVPQRPTHTCHPDMQLCCSGALPGGEQARGGHQRGRHHRQLQPRRCWVSSRVWRGRQRQLAGPGSRQALCCSVLVLHSAGRAAAINSPGWPADSSLHGPHCLVCTPPPSAEAGHSQFADAGCIVNAAADVLCGRGKDSWREVTELTATPMLAWLWDQMVAQQQAPAPALAARQTVRQEERMAQPGFPCAALLAQGLCVPA